MLQERGRQKDIVRVLDFGIAKLRDDNRATQQAMTQAGDMLGTPQYMAPEQIKGESIDGRTDGRRPDLAAFARTHGGVYLPPSYVDTVDTGVLPAGRY